MTEDINDISRRDRWADGQKIIWAIYMISDLDLKNEASGRDCEEEQMDDQID
jgi:hypothetical protein